MRTTGVWLAVAGLVRRGNDVLVVKKRYGGMKGLYSFPAGFVMPGETLDEAVVREVKEETAVDAVVRGVLGVRTGVLRNGVSDNLVLFLLDYVGGTPHPQESEIEEARFLSMAELVAHPLATEFLRTFLPNLDARPVLTGSVLKPRADYGYDRYKIFR